MCQHVAQVADGLGRLLGLRRVLRILSHLLPAPPAISTAASPVASSIPPPCTTSVAPSRDRSIVVPSCWLCVGLWLWPPVVIVTGILVCIFDLRRRVSAHVCRWGCMR